jgi:D-serine deaminase-like pyridoxal phosphate-dependent protein
MNALDLETPAPFIDLDVLERNLRRMQELCGRLSVGLRPHTKTHKIPEIARMQLALGAVGLTVAKLGEAEVMPGDDILVAYPLVPAKVPRLRELARKRRLTVAVDSVESARALYGVAELVEVDVGLGRSGVQTPEEYDRVAQSCTGFRGLFYYPDALDRAGIQRAAGIVRSCLAVRKGEVVSGGSTPNAAQTPEIPETTEIRPGTYVFYDASSIATGVCGAQDCALRVLVSVVSAAVPGQCVVDGGSKTFSQNPTQVVGGFGQFADRPWTIEKMNEEHGYVKIDQSARVGEKLWVIPAHAGTTVNLHDEIAYGRQGKLEGTWSVAARGRVR